MAKLLYIEKLVAHVNRKEWWHVPPRTRSAYSERGKFFASSFREAEFWGRPLDEPQRVAVSTPLAGDERTIEIKLFGRPTSHEDLSMEQRWRLDARMKDVALRKGYDSILLMTTKAFDEFKACGKLPRSMELNILRVRVVPRRRDDEATVPRRPKHKRKSTMGGIKT
jgi:hypothetical protein